MKAEEIRALSPGEMQNKLKELKHELFNLRFQKGIGQLENPCKIRDTRKDIARIQTILTEMAKTPEGTDN